MIKEMRFTEQMLDRLQRAHDRVTGTSDHSKYLMETYSGKTFVGHGLPYATGDIKLSRGVNSTLCIYTRDYRYILTDSVKELLCIKENLTAIKGLRSKTGMSITALAKVVGIPLRTWQAWEAGDRECPKYVFKLIEYYLKNEKLLDRK